MNKTKQEALERARDLFEGLLYCNDNDIYECEMDEISEICIEPDLTYVLDKWVNTDTDYFEEINSFLRYIKSRYQCIGIAEDDSGVKILQLLPL